MCINVLCTSTVPHSLGKWTTRNSIQMQPWEFSNKSAFRNCPLFSLQNLYYLWFVSLLSCTSGSFSNHIPLALGEFLFTEHRVLARPGGICTVNLHWCWSAMVNPTPNAVCIHWTLSDQAKCRSGFNSCLALSCRRESFFFLGFASLTQSLRPPTSETFNAAQNGFV